MTAFRVILITIFLGLFRIGFSQDYSEVESLANSFIENYGIKGIGIVGVQNGETVFLSADGMANDSAEFSDSTRVYIASNTKAFVGLAMAKLASEGKISYSDPIINYIPREKFPDSIKVDDINIKNILTHTHGLSNDPLTFRTAYSGEYPSDLQELLKFTVYRKDDHSKDFKYSNLGYLLAGMIIEKVTGDKWQDYLKKEVLNPLGMEVTGAKMNFDPELEVLPYSFTTVESLSSRKSENTLHAAGGLYSTLPDMGKWLRVLTSDASKVAGVELKKYLDDRTSVEEKEAGGLVYSKDYGNGWIFGDLFGKENIYYSFGRFNGYESVMSFDPVSKKGVFVFVNERMGGIYVASLLNSFFYFISEENPEAQQMIEPVLEMIEKVYSAPADKLEKVFTYEDSHALTGIYRSPEYGTLLVDRDPDGYSFQLGKMKSYGFSGKNKNEILVEWTPGIREHLFISEEDGKILIRYGEFDVFSKI